ncbi:DEBR0S3_07998g1_1 [Brettanomyces bruxellensis]|uniref:DEBR0S3_07998g1_1 n=1 Tax=Dekkera bruxellensis TaxID=5007 RepID=A0A7D9CYI7_DEKBR|nr:uncharacterized protein BRETT_000558 [Brettanomyces bruxellensis]QOU20844.1 hypothetical protein BRETT_000558 [Brettanomyces bruxellensis]VUG18333.1 DEBR0S3_07998g1_1 [Brettanomyces bruxellensis]
MSLTSCQQYSLDRTSKQSTTVEKYQFGDQDADIKPTQGGLQWFPDTSMWNIEDIQRELGHMTFKPASKWSVDRISRFFSLIERKSIELQQSRPGFGHQYQKLPISTVLNCANTAFGFCNWSSEVVPGSGKLVKYAKSDDAEQCYNVDYELKIRLILKDGTTLTRNGTGSARSLPLSQEFSKCRKEAMTNGLKNCFYSLIGLLVDYEGKVKDGYYDRYKS